MNKKYNAGRRKEYELKKELEGLGYCATRAAGSKGAFDIIAYNENHVRFIQVKYEQSPTSYSADIAKMKSTKVPQFCTKELWIYTKNDSWRTIVING